MYLNNEPFYLRLALDQGYWPESILTPPSDEAIQYDIRMTKAFGLNGEQYVLLVRFVLTGPPWRCWRFSRGELARGRTAIAHRYRQVASALN